VLRETLAWTEEQFVEHFRGTPVKRLGLRRWQRNALTVIGNTGTGADLSAVRTLLGHTDPMVAEHAVWAERELVARL
jgi:epoxyqueuosine reductase